ncbi:MULTISPECIES: RIP metalloprotease RseP [Carnobacterium]|uniref:RIP metalloprotease RseP n=1 Tax=Carnobacterium TaxID=2747 RepID=UPI000D4EA0F3|nr:MULTISPECIES: RIP metalloprotease RseP [Carnobacterium]MCO6017920.1 RIP metalloprotease RseP [Carnobacterium divergens]MDT1938723.1 RIP metalloprotease RseP [Carnobacterium divergens]MDT1941161.1 RIP metalloprotease RseP [Carnobacterium divergens]MDT1946959.1 RIP metalloprotease RseP [Carnobacterium divergens]MDT1949396.1 RIP metalloprotease RseP [Carnobacterium divergens]
MITTIITFIIVFSILVVVHEFGHYYFAKKSGILVREFAIGFGPKIFSYRKNGTTYTLRILPIGGYVRMAGFGEEETEIKPGMPVGLVINSDNLVTTINTSKKTQLLNAVPMEVVALDLEKELFIEGYLAGNEDELIRYSVLREATVIEEDGTEVQIAPIDVQFQSASLPKRMMTNFAGPMNNFILAIIAFTIMAFMQGGVVSHENQLGEIMPNSVAAKAGLKEGDKVLEVAGKKTTTWVEIAQEIQKHPAKKINLKVETTKGETKVISLTPEKQDTGDGKKVGMIGIKAAMDTSFIAKISYGFTQTWFVIVQILTILGSMFTKGFSINMFSGPVGIYATTQQVVQTGFYGVFNWLAFLSVNLGIVNLLPIPALDGGKLLLNIIEGIRRKPLDPEKEGIITMVGFGLLMLLMVLVTWNDIQRYFFN